MVSALLKEVIDKSRIGLALGPFRLAVSPSRRDQLSSVALAEVLEAAGGLAGRGSLYELGLKEFDGDLLDEPRVARQADTRSPPGSLRTRPSVASSGEPEIGAQKDARPGPPHHLRDDPRHFLDRARAAVDVRPPELGGQQMLGHRTHTEAGSSNSRSSRGRTDLPDGRAAGRQSRRDRE